MAATAATIQIALEAQTAQLKKGFDQSRRSVDNLGKSMSGKVAAGMAKFHVGLAAVKGVMGAMRGAINGVADAMGRLDEEAKVAASLGMAADQLKILNFAAEQTGSSADTMQQSLRRMNRRIGQAAKGSGEAKNALTDLGLSAERMLGMDADQQFAAIADAMDGVATNTEKTQLAMDIFGRQGAELINTMAIGSEGLDEYGQELEDMGALLGDGRKGIEGTNDAINRMSKAWGAFVDRIAIIVAPILEGIVNLLSKVISGFNKLFGSATQTAGKAASVAGAATKAAAGIGEINQEIEKTGDKTITAAEKARDIVAKVKDDFRDAINPEQAIGAVTRGSSAGFSAVQETKRAQRDARRRDERRNDLLGKIYEALRAEGIHISTVDIGTI